MRFKSNGCSVTPGKRYLLDTNALVALLQGHDRLLALNGQAQWLGVSALRLQWQGDVIQAQRHAWQHYLPDIKAFVALLKQEFKWNLGQTQITSKIVCCTTGLKTRYLYLVRAKFFLAFLSTH